MSDYLSSMALAWLAYLVITRCHRNRGDWWRLVIYTSIGLSGLLAPYGLGIADEVALLSACLAVQVADLPRGYSTQSRSDRFRKVHEFFFTLLLVYLFFQTFRGIVVLESPRKIRWLVFFALILISNRLAGRLRSLTPSPAQLARFTCIAGSGYLAFYCFSGLLPELMLGLSKYDFQPLSDASEGGGFLLWGTSAYTLFCLAIVIPCSLILLSSNISRDKTLGWSSLAIASLASIYYDSRTGIIILLGFMTLSARLVGLKRLFLASGMMCLILLGFLTLIWGPERDLTFFLDDLLTSGGALWSNGDVGASGRDIDRYLQLKVAFTCIDDDLLHFFFGYGYRVSGFVVGEHLLDLMSILTPEKLIRLQSDYSNVGTEAFTAFVIDTGLVGLSLLVLNFGTLGLRIISGSARPAIRILLLATVFVIFGWMFIIDFRDVVLFYICVMPNGLIANLSHFSFHLTGQSRMPSSVIRRTISEVYLGQSINQ